MIVFWIALTAIGTISLVIVALWWIEAIVVWTALTAIGTISLAIVAVFQDRLRSLLTRPDLKVSFVMDRPYCAKTTMTLGNVEAKCYYFRFRVHNNGNDSARFVEARISELKKKVGGKHKDLASFLPMNLTWTHVGRNYVDLISPQMDKYCDFGKIVDPTQRHLIPRENPKIIPLGEKTLFSLALEAQPNNFSHLIEPGKYRAKLVLGASNAKTIEKNVDFHIKGEWFDEELEMFDKGITIEIT